MRPTLPALLAPLTIRLYLASPARASEGKRIMRADGGIVSFGDARFAGSTPSARRAVGVAA